MHLQEQPYYPHQPSARRAFRRITLQGDWHNIGPQQMTRPPVQQVNPWIDVQLFLLVVAEEKRQSFDSE